MHIKEAELLNLLSFNEVFQLPDEVNRQFVDSLKLSDFQERDDV
jgi:hypothetical protein